MNRNTFERAINEGIRKGGYSRRKPISDPTIYSYVTSQKLNALQSV